MSMHRPRFLWCTSGQHATVLYPSYFLSRGRASYVRYSWSRLIRCCDRQIVVRVPSLSGKHLRQSKLEIRESTPRSIAFTSPTPSAHPCHQQCIPIKCMLCNARCEHNDMILFRRSCNMRRPCDCRPRCVRASATSVAKHGERSSGRGCETLT